MTNVRQAASRSCQNKWLPMQAISTKLPQFYGLLTVC